MRKEYRFEKHGKLLWIMLLCFVGWGCNLILNGIVGMMDLPFYFDTVGTIFAAAVGGALPGILVALLTNTVLGFGNPNSIYFGILNVLIAAVTAVYARSRYKKKLWAIISYVICLALIGGGVGAVMTWLFDGFSLNGSFGNVVRYFYEGCGMDKFPAHAAASVAVDLVDKAISALIALLAVICVPPKFRDNFRFTGWSQTPLYDEELAQVKNTKCQTASLRTKILLVLIVAFVVVAFVATGISLMLFRNFSRGQHIQIAKGAAAYAAQCIDAEKVDEYMERGEAAEGYLETKEILSEIRENAHDVEYMYVYKIMDDGCHVVFDLDTERIGGSRPGEVVAFDSAFYPYLDALKRGEPIEPVISNESYGWLLTVYLPVYDAKGRCACYVGADVAMENLAFYEEEFLIKMSSLFMGFFVLILAIGLWLSKYQLIYPINTMAYSASAFAYNSEEAREHNVEQIRKLKIHTGDELENLYHAFVKTTEDSMDYFAQMQHKTETISRLQSGLLMVLADLVENRDESTGNHIKKTAAYTRAIMEKARELGYYTQQLTDTFISDVEQSAPLHDIGKIQIPDAILNKCGKLTEEEFAVMKTHTTAGMKIIDQTIATLPDADYLTEARNMATYHHEKWNGKGYPFGLTGEEIPLSARVMAVADVFDALISKRCYKDAFPFEKAVQIIREDSGSHFDPKIVEAFLAAETKIKEISERYADDGDNPEPEKTINTQNQE